mmetsp:Transcript_57123/g.135857  ORF Transcript_57123/g.135857 Transcript_57123/m.135857 type:complete len:81 (+) Transcript_57123:18-260(+)
MAAAATGEVMKATVTGAMPKAAIVPELFSLAQQLRTELITTFVQKMLAVRGPSQKTNAAPLTGLQAKPMSGTATATALPK